MARKQRTELAESVRVHHSQHAMWRTTMTEKALKSALRRLPDVKVATMR